MLCLVFFVDGLGGWMGERCECFVGHGARYWRLIDGISQTVEVIKSPRSSRGFEGVGY